MKKFIIITLLFFVLLVAVINIFIIDQTIQDYYMPTYQEIYDAEIEGGDELANPLKAMVTKSFESKIYYLRNMIDQKSESHKFVWDGDSNWLTFFPLTNDLFNEILPDLLTKYKKLTELHLPSNKLTFIPAGLGQTTC